MQNALYIVSQWHSFLPCKTRRVCTNSTGVPSVRDGALPAPPLAGSCSNIAVHYAHAVLILSLVFSLYDPFVLSCVCAVSRSHLSVSIPCAVCGLWSSLVVVLCRNDPVLFPDRTSYQATKVELFGFVNLVRFSGLGFFGVYLGCCWFGL